MEIFIFLSINFILMNQHISIVLERFVYTELGAILLPKKQNTERVLHSHTMLLYSIK